MENKKYKTIIPEYKMQVPFRVLRKNIIRKPRGVTKEIFRELTPKQQVRILVMQGSNVFYSDKVPKNFIKLDVSTATPKGYSWYGSKMTRFDPKYSVVKVLVKK